MLFLEPSEVGEEIGIGIGQNQRKAATRDKGGRRVLTPSWRMKEGLSRES